MSTITRTCLNGWWDFLPLAERRPPPHPPAAGWLPAACLVPSVWTKSTEGVRLEGERHVHGLKGPSKFQRPAPEGAYYLFDSFRYPQEWANAPAAWYRRTLTLAVLPPGRRRFLRLEGVMPRATLVVNGTVVGTHVHPALPWEVDVSALLHPGDNELAVLVDDCDRDRLERPLTPSGNGWLVHHRGVWQDIHLIERGEVLVEAVAVRTAWRERRLEVELTVANRSDRARTIELRPSVRDWQRVPWHQAWAAQDGSLALALAPQTVAVPAGGRAQARWSVAWPEVRPWMPESPTLYQLRTVVAEDGREQEVHGERFGFREVRIDGPRLLLNEVPLHLFSDWGHKHTVHCLGEGWVRKWFAMIRAANMNHSRLHTHPHPEMILTLADEEGILITGETGLHGSGGAQATEDDLYWERARDHVVRFVARDRNHPALVLWSVGNEMRWNGPGLERSQEELPRLRALFGALDPTRPAYFEGDTSLWDERGQAIINRHYGKVCSGAGWWDRSQPLHAGELSLHHLAGPNNTLHLAGDAVWADWWTVEEAAGRDLQWIVEDGRALGVTAFGPWNLSCLSNIRPTAETVRFQWSDWSAPGMKPLWAEPHSVEFAWWESGPGYERAPSFALHAAAFRPLAVIDRSRRGQHLAGRPFVRELAVVNDTTGALQVEVEAALSGPAGVLASARTTLAVARGAVATWPVALPVPADANGDHTWQVRARVDGTEREAWSRPLRIASAGAGAAPPSRPVAVLGTGLDAVLEELGIPFRLVPDASARALAGAQVLVIAPFAVRCGSDLNVQVRRFCARGGRVVVLEQEHSLFPALGLEIKAVQTAFVRCWGHPALAGLADRDLAFWGDQPYSQADGDALIARRLFRKDDGTRVTALVDTGEGAFGSGGLEHAALVEVRAGRGLVLACQLRLTEVLAAIPAARILLRNLVAHAAAWKAPRPRRLVEVAGNTTAPRTLARALAAARRGATVHVAGATPAALAAWSQALGLDLHPGGAGSRYQAVRVAEHPLLAGVSNDDTSGIESWCYSDWSEPKPDNRELVPVPIAPVAGLEPLLELATRSLGEEMMVRGGKTEPLRAYTASVHRWRAEREGGPGQPGIALGLVAAGRGRVLFDQVVPPTAAEQPVRRARYARLAARLRANLGHGPTDGLLDGETIPEPAGAGPGFPVRLFACSEELGAEAVERMISATRPSRDGMWAKPILQVAAFAAHEAPTGVWRADTLGAVPAAGAALAAGRALWLYFLCDSPTRRANAEMDLAVPNPEALTFLDLHGCGSVELTVNTRAHPPVTMDGGTATVPDIELEQGKNHVLLRWVPGRADATLGLRWRTIMGATERWLTFPT